MDRYKITFTVFAITVTVLGLTVAASAQWRNRRGNDNNYGRNNVYLYSAVKNLRNNSRRFEDILDRQLDRSRYDGTRREDQMNRLAGRFKNAAENLDDEYDGGRRIGNSYDEARRVINYGSQLDRALSRSRLTSNNFSLRNHWRNIERDLSTIARAYNIRYNRGYGRDRGNRRDGRRGRRGRDGNRRYNRNLRATIVNLKNKSRRFENRIDREVRGQRRNRRRYYGNLENLSDRFKNAADRLEDEYDNDRDYNDSYDEARRVLSIGQQLDRKLSGARVSSRTRRDWNRIEQDLRILANAYNLSYNGRYNTRSPWGVGNILRKFPF